MAGGIERVYWLRLRLRLRLSERIYVRDAKK